MSVFQVHADLCYFLLPSSLLLSPFVFVISDIVSRSFTSHLKAGLLSPSVAVWLMFRPRTSLLCFACDTFVFPCHLCILHAIFVALLFLRRVIMPLSLVLSLQYLWGYLSAVVLLLSPSRWRLLSLAASSRALMEVFTVPLRFM